MSIVGTRPPLISETNLYEPRHKVTFKNDTVNIQNRDEVLTYMIHLGYLGYDQNRRSAFVPNEEIRQELTLAVREIVV